MQPVLILACFILWAGMLIDHIMLVCRVRAIEKKLAALVTSGSPSGQDQPNGGKERM